MVVAALCGRICYRGGGRGCSRGDCGYSRESVWESEGVIVCG